MQFPTWGYFVLLAVQFGLQPTLNKWCIPTGVTNTLLIVVTECMKIILSLIILVGMHGTKLMRESLFASPSKTMRYALAPAALYSIQNWLIFTSLRYLSPLSMSLLNQTKTLSAAGFAYWLLGKRQTAWQIVALVGLMFGASLIVSAEQQGNTNKEEYLLVGIPFVAMASLLSGLSSALTEIALHQSSTNNSGSGAAASLVFSIELAAMSLPVLLFSLVAGLNPDSHQFYQGHTGLYKLNLLSLVPLCTSALGGILVGVVTQKFGGVKKGFALILGICFAAAFEAAFGAKQFTMVHLTAVLTVCASMWMYFTHPYISAQQQPEKEKNL